VPVEAYGHRQQKSRQVVICRKWQIIEFQAAEVVLLRPLDDLAAATGSDAEKLAEFREVRDEIDTKIRARLAEVA
jgi:hypothetical protein